MSKIKAWHTSFWVLNHVFFIALPKQGMIFLAAIDFAFSLNKEYLYGYSFVPLVEM